MGPELLADIEAVKALKAHYFRLMDTKLWADWRALFTDDLEVIVDVGIGGEPRFRVISADAFVDSTRANIDAAVTVHHGHMPEIEITSPTTASGVWAMEDIVEAPGAPAFHGHGHYHETYRKIDGAWRIATLHLTRLRTSTL